MANETTTPTRRRRAAFCGDPRQIASVYGGGRREAVAVRADLCEGIITGENIRARAASGALADIECVFSTWGMPRFTEDDLDALPSLKAVFYAAGSVQAFADPLLSRGILLSSAWRSNAVPVAEFTLAQILLSCKGYFRNAYASQTFAGRTGKPFSGAGVYGETVALLGAGAIGRLVVELLKPFTLRIVVFDPFLSDADAAAMGVEKVTLEDAFRRGYVVSNHLANNAQTRGMLNAPLFALLRDNATFINTGRGATVVESDLIAFLARRPDVTALLDVTEPEPPPLDSPFYDLPNAHLSSHIAGSLGDEVRRMADAMLEEFARYERGEPLLHAVTRQSLATMA